MRGRIDLARHRHARPLAQLPHRDPGRHGLPSRLPGHPRCQRRGARQRFGGIYEAEGVRSLLVAPLQLESGQPDAHNAGTITFYWRTPRVFSELDVAYASALANLASTALNLSELHEQNQREKRRLSFLAEASAVLASSLDYETTLQRVAHLAVPHIADWCAVHILENGVPNRLVVAHADSGHA